MKTPNQKQPVRKARGLVTVEVALPRAFFQKYHRRCESSNITLAEAIRFVAETGIPQQLGDEGLELDLLRHVLGFQPRTCHQ